MHSHHDSDVARGQHNAWDLVRLHKFAHFDEGYDGPIHQAPSHLAMVALAMADPLVQKELVKDAGFDVVPEPVAAPTTGTVNPLLARFKSPPADLLTLELPRRSYALWPYVPSRCVTVLPGAGGSGKSYWLLGALLCRAAGLPVPGVPAPGGDVTITAGRVYYFSMEDDFDEVLRRMRAILRTFSPADAQRALANITVFDGVGSGLQLVQAGRHGGAAIVRGPAGVDGLVEIITSLGDAAVIAIDTLSRVSDGNENANELMARVVVAGEIIAQATGAGVIVVHHVSKVSAKTGDTSAQSARGGGALGDCARSIVAMAAVTGKEAARYDLDPVAVAQCDILQLVHAKNSYGKKTPPLWLHRIDDGLLVPIVPAKRADADRSAAHLESLARWWLASDRQPVSRNAIARKLRAVIWPSETPSVEVVKSLITAQIKAGLIRTAGNLQGGQALVLDDERATALLAAADDASGWNDDGEVHDG